MVEGACQNVAWKNAGKTAQYYSVPVHIHIVGYNNGSGFFGEDKAYQLVCELNRRFLSMNIFFFLDGRVTYISNSLYANPTAPYINQMMGLYNNPLACNIYIVPALTGLCGLTYFPNQGPAQGRGGIVLKGSCAGPGNSDPAHEMGHYFSLLHTFQGASGTAPELVNGSNCTTAGDFFCDTRADWQDFRWNCPYAGNKQDPNGDFYKPDSSLYMGYANVPTVDTSAAVRPAALSPTTSRRRVSTGKRTPTISTPFRAARDPCADHGGVASVAPRSRAPWHSQCSRGLRRSPGARLDLLDRAHFLRP